MSLTDTQGTKKDVESQEDNTQKRWKCKRRDRKSKETKKNSSAKKCTLIAIKILLQGFKAHLNRQKRVSEPEGSTRENITDERLGPKGPRGHREADRHVPRGNLRRGEKRTERLSE